MIVKRRVCLDHCPFGHRATDDLDIRDWFRPVCLLGRSHFFESLIQQSECQISIILRLQVYYGF